MKLLLLVFLASSALAVNIPTSNKAAHPYEFVRTTSKRANDVGTKTSVQPQFSRSKPAVPNEDKTVVKKSSGIPPYAVSMEPLVKYSQPDPLYDANKDSTDKKSSKEEKKDAKVKKDIANDLYDPGLNHEINSKSDFTIPYEDSEVAAGHHPFHGHHVQHPRPVHYYHEPAYHEPEPIIEIIIKESNQSLPAPPPLPTPPKKKKKEQVQVFYVKYKKDPSSHYGEEKIIYDPPVPAVTPPTNNGDSHDEEEEEVQEDHHHSYEDHTLPPKPSTTLKAIIKPESETYQGSGIHITFGGPKDDDSYGGHANNHHHHSQHNHHNRGDFEQPSDPEPAVVLPPKRTLTVAPRAQSQLTKRNPSPFQSQTPPPQQSFGLGPSATPFFQRPTSVPSFQQAPQFPAQQFRPPFPKLQPSHAPPSPTPPRPNPILRYSTLPQHLQPFPKPQQSHFPPLQVRPPQQSSLLQPQAQTYYTINQPHLKSSFQINFRPTVPPQYQTISSQASQHNSFGKSQSTPPSPPTFHQPQPQPPKSFPPPTHHSFSQQPPNVFSQPPNSHFSQHQPTSSFPQPQPTNAFPQPINSFSQPPNPFLQSQPQPQPQPTFTQQQSITVLQKSQPPVIAQQNTGVNRPALHSQQQSQSPSQPQLQLQHQQQQQHQFQQQYQQQQHQLQQQQYQQQKHQFQQQYQQQQKQQLLQQHQQQVEQLNRLQQQQQRLQSQILQDQQKQNFLNQQQSFQSGPEIIKSIQPDVSFGNHRFEAKKPEVQSGFKSQNPLQHQTQHQSQLQLQHQIQHQTQHQSQHQPTVRPTLHYTIPNKHTEPTRKYTPPKTTTTERAIEYITDDPKKAEEERKKKEERKKQNVAALPKEVPDDLREQLLSSDILGNADIQILDYDKIGDIPIESLPPEALANFQAVAGSQPVPSIARPDPREEPEAEASEFQPSIVAPPNSPQGDIMEMKVVRFNPESQEGAKVANKYVREDATQLEPVVLNDSKYNRYLPLKVSGAQFPVPDVPELRGKNVTSVVVLAPVDYEFLQHRENLDDNDRAGRRSSHPVLEVQGVHFIAGDVLKSLVKKPTTENYNKWLDKENQTALEKQSVVLLVIEPEFNTTQQKEIYMYDISTQKVSKLSGELSAQFVEVAESNSENDGLDDISDNPGGDFTIKDSSKLAVNTRKQRKAIPIARYNNSILSAR